MIQESSADKRQSLYLYTDEGSYEPLARIDTDGNQEQHIRYFHTDLNGMPEELTDEAGEIVWECSYQLWGKPIQEIAHTEIQQNLRYQGQYLDRETGLHYNTFRYYDPDIGRFTQPDPIGLAGGLNLYQYAPNAFMWIDPWGWSCIKGRIKNLPTKKSPYGELKDKDFAVLDKGLNDIFNGRGIPRLDDHGKQKIFQGKGAPNWKGALEWEVIPGNGNYRILTKQLPNGKTQVGFTDKHYKRILEVFLD